MSRQKANPTVSGIDPASLITVDQKLPNELITTTSGSVDTAPPIDTVAKRAPRLYTMKTEKFGPDKIFLYVSRDSIPEGEVNRFLQLCEGMILALGEASLNDTDIEEIALIYRDRIYTDRQYRIFAQSEAMDTAMVAQIEKLNKALEQRKLNLGARFIDKGKPRKDSEVGESFMDLFNHYVENTDKIREASINKKNQIAENLKNFTKTSDYMTNSSPQAQAKKDAKETKED